MSESKSKRLIVIVSNGNAQSAMVINNYLCVEGGNASLEEKLKNEIKTLQDEIERLKGGVE